LASQNEERANRILDAAAKLIERWSYKKTTIDDIAKQAGVAKGTIYLHWKTREELFRAVIVHEELKVTEDMKQRVANDPEGSTLHAMLKHWMLAIIKRPIWKAVFLRDTDMLGELVRTEYTSAAAQEGIAGFTTYLEFLRGRGLIRTDQDVQQQIYMMNAIAIGFLLADPFLPEEMKLPDEEVAELLAETIRCAFDSRESVASGERQEISYAFNQYINREIDILKGQDQKEVES